MSKWASLLSNPGVQKVVSAALFILWPLLAGIYGHLPEAIVSRPSGEHVWANCDRASVASVYYQDHNSFFLPAVHLSPDETGGISAGEFPLIPYTVSKLYGAFGFHEWLHRLFVLLLSVTGFWFAYRIAALWLSSPVAASLVAAIWIISPNLLYYSASFLPDVPALAAILISLYFLFRHRESPRRMDLIGFAVFFALASLLKSSASLAELAIAAAWWITTGRKSLRGWKKKAGFGLSIAVPLAVTCAWVLYARHLTQEYGTFVFLLEPLPPASWNEFMEGLQTFFSFSYYYLPRPVLYLIPVGTLLAFLRIRHTTSFFPVAAVFCYIAWLLTFILLFEKMPTHFYYSIPFQVGILFHLLWIGEAVLSFKPDLKFSLLIFAAGLVFMNLSVVDGGKTVKARLTHDQNFPEWFRMETALDSLGVDYSKRVFSYDDYTFNCTLYLMNRKGVSANPQTPEEKIIRDMRTCDVAVLSDTLLFQHPEIRKQIGKKLGEAHGLSVYTLHQPQ